MLVVWSALLGVLIFMGLVVATLAFGAAANRAEKKALIQTEAERLAGLEGEVTSNNARPLGDRYIEA